MIKINVEWKGNGGFQNLIRYINSAPFVEIEAEATSLAESTVQHMRDTISTSKKRKSFGSNLEDTIDFTEVLNDPGKELIIGIGNIAKLKTDAPYFEVLDKGGYVPYSTVKGAPLGSFEGDAPSNLVPPVQNWERSGDKGFFMKPKKPITGIDYMGKAFRYLDQEFQKMLANWGANFIAGTEGASNGRVNLGKSTFVKAWGKKVRFYKKGGVDMG